MGCNFSPGDPSRTLPRLAPFHKPCLSMRDCIQLPESWSSILAHQDNYLEHEVWSINSARLATLAISAPRASDSLFDLWGHRLLSSLPCKDAAPFTGACPFFPEAWSRWDVTQSHSATKWGGGWTGLLSLPSARERYSQP